MATTDSKLFRVFTVAGEKRFSSRAELAREIADREFDEFSYEEDGVRQYLAWRGVQEYVAFSSMIGILDGELQPYIRVDQITRKGFYQSLGERVERFAEGSGFPEQKIKNAIRSLLSQSPIQLPSPKAIYKIVGPTCQYNIFYKAVTVSAFQERSKLFVRSRQTFVANGLFESAV